jgi:hypothetical protein
MNSIRTLATVVAVFGMSSFAQAGLFDHLFGGHFGGGCCDDACDASKCCDCAPVYEPCKPVIVRPCCKNVYIYQRQLSCIKPPCGDVGCCNPCGDGSCVPSGACGPSACCPSSNNACCPSGNNACCPGGNNACCPGGNNACCPGGNNACCPGGNNACCPGGNACCPETCCPCDPHEACEVAMLIYWSQTQCKAHDREKAIDDLGDYNVLCYPEIMCAWIYALNDTSPEVRAEAADEIGDAFEDYPCLASQCVVDALTCALADCDKDVVHEAEEALENAGYEIVDECPNDEICCDMNCAPGCGPGCAPVNMPAAPMSPEGTAPAPAPPEESKAYFPSQLPQQVSRHHSRFSLSRLFSLVD